LEWVEKEVKNPDGQMNRVETTEQKKGSVKVG